MQSIYLDYNAAAPLIPEAKAAMLRVLEMTGNPSSIHGFGRRLRGEIETARQSVAALVGARPHDVIFTSGGTEANNAVMNAFGTGRHMIVSAGEHPSILKAASPEMVLPLAAEGSIEWAALEHALNAAAPGCPILVSVMMANNETGVLNPIKDIIKINNMVNQERQHRIHLHSDAVQAVGKIPMDDLDLDYITISAHKIGGPRGIGALVIRHNGPFVADRVGGGQEDGRRAGTEDAAAIAGFGAAATAAAHTLSQWGRVAALRDDFEQRLLAHIPEAVIFGHGQPRLPNTCCCALPGISSDVQLMHLDLAGIAVSSGSACSSGRVEPSTVLSAMGVHPDLAACAIRISLGLSNTESDIDDLLSQLTVLHGRSHRHAASA